MKNPIIVLMAACSLLVVPACQKSGSDLYTGHYSFKTGGYVEIDGTVSHLLDSVVRDTTIVRYLSNGSGQMHVVKAGGDSLKVTMNFIGGAPLVFDAAVTPDALVLAPTQSRMEFYKDNSLLSGDATIPVTLSGTGHRYENMLIIDLDLRGEYESNQFEGSISTSHVNCIAVQNE